MIYLTVRSFGSLLTQRYRLLADPEELDQRATDQAEQRPQARRLMTHLSVGPVTVLASEVFLGDPSGFLECEAVARSEPRNMAVEPDEARMAELLKRAQRRIDVFGQSRIFVWCR